MLEKLPEQPCKICNKPATNIFHVKLSFSKHRMHGIAAWQTDRGSVGA